MSELDKAYEAVDMLKALDLPISKAQLDDIERLEEEYGKEHREDLGSYFFEKCFTIYTKRIMNIKQAKIRGEVIVAKPVLLLAIIDGVSNDMFKDNEIQLTEWLESRYMMLMQQYMKSSQFDKPTNISNPFWHRTHGDRPRESILQASLLSFALGCYSSCRFSLSQCGHCA